jgi:hypothetical protein
VSNECLRESAASGRTSGLGRHICTYALARVSDRALVPVDVHAQVRGRKVGETKPAGLTLPAIGGHHEITEVSFSGQGIAGLLWCMAGCQFLPKDKVLIARSFA